MHAQERDEETTALIRKAINQHYFKTGVWQNIYYKGMHCFKYPTDLWTYAEILYEVRPTVIVETGTSHGGSAQFFRDMSGAKVITIDAVDEVINKDPNIVYLHGHSGEQEMLERVQAHIAPLDIVMVSLDSDHTLEHVRKELRLYADLVTPGSYLVTEDTFISIFDCKEERFEAGSTWEAVQEWLPTCNDFYIDARRDKHLITMNPNGWLRRKFVFESPSLFANEVS